MPADALQRRAIEAIKRHKSAFASSIPAGTVVERKNCTQDPTDAHRVPAGTVGVASGVSVTHRTKGKEMVAVLFDEPIDRLGKRPSYVWLIAVEKLIPVD